MQLLTADIHARLLANGREQEPVRGTDREIDFHPVVKLFTPDADCTWILTEIDPENPDIAFGLCDLGMGFPELGSRASRKSPPCAEAWGSPSSVTCTSRPRNGSRLTPRRPRASTASKLNANKNGVHRYA